MKLPQSRGWLAQGRKQDLATCCTAALFLHAKRLLRACLLAPPLCAALASSLRELHEAAGHRSPSQNGDVFMRAGGSVDVEEFLAAAVTFCNEQCFGTLSCCLAVHPSAHAAHRAAVESAVGDLRYGSIGVNVSASLGGISAVMPWGAWAAAGTPEDIGTGNVLSHSGVYDHIEKGVMWGRWMMGPTPLLFASNTNLDRTMARVAQYVRSRGPVSELRVVLSALRSR